MFCVVALHFDEIYRYTDFIDRFLRILGYSRIIENVWTDYISDEVLCVYCGLLLSCKNIFLMNYNIVRKRFTILDNEFRQLVPRRGVFSTARLRHVEQLTYFHRRRYLLNKVRAHDWITDFSTHREMPLKFYTYTSNMSIEIRQ